MLTEIKMYKSATETSGFRVRFDVWPKRSFRGWASYTYMFGTQDHATHETVTFTNDIKTLYICMDGDFESFRFIDYNGVDQTIGPSDCSPTEAIELTGVRLIGFKVVEGDAGHGIRNIRSIAPIIATPPACSESTTSLRGPAVGHQTINIGLDTVLVPIAAEDILSQRYFEQDGYSYCGEREYFLSHSEHASISTDEDPSGAKLVVSSDSFADQAT